MKITLEPYSGGTYTAQNEAEHINEIAKMFKGLLVQVGYHPNSVDNLFSEDLERWFAENDASETQSFDLHSYNSQTT